jgi:hypothetical protein
VPFANAAVCLIIRAEQEGLPVNHSGRGNQATCIRRHAGTVFAYHPRIDAQREILPKHSHV